MKSKSIRATLKVWYPPLVATILLYALIPYVRNIQDFIVKNIGKHSDSIIYSGLAIVLIFFFLFAYWKLQWRSPKKYLVFVATMFLYFLAIRFFQNIDKSVRVVEVIHYIEYGIVSYLYFRAYRKWIGGQVHLVNFLVPVILMSIIGTLDESIQWFLQCRVGEIRDIHVNVAAGLLPQIFLFLLYMLDSKTVLCLPRSSVPVLMDGLIIFVLLVTVFYSYAHMGYVVNYNNQWQILSHFTQEQLTATATNDASIEKIYAYLHSNNRWKPENYYVTEAMGHEGARNKNYEGSEKKDYKDRRPDLAHYENEILETLFKPYLDAAGARWSPEQKQECIIASRNRPQKSYQSPIGKFILNTTLNRTVYWGVTILVIVILIAIRSLVARKKQV